MKSRKDVSRIILSTLSSLPEGVRQALSKVPAHEALSEHHIAYLLAATREYPTSQIDYINLLKNSDYQNDSSVRNVFEDEEKKAKAKLEGWEKIVSGAVESIKKITANPGEFKLTGLACSRFPAPSPSPLAPSCSSSAVVRSIPGSGRSQ